MFYTHLDVWIFSQASPHWNTNLADWTCIDFSIFSGNTLDYSIRISPSYRHPRRVKIFRSSISEHANIFRKMSVQLDSVARTAGGTRRCPVVKSFAKEEFLDAEGQPKLHTGLSPMCFAFRVSLTYGYLRWFAIANIYPSHVKKK